MYLNAQITVTTVGAGLASTCAATRASTSCATCSWSPWASPSSATSRFPTAPPRFFPEWGFVDSVAAFTGVDADTGSADALFNPYAAVPSMHVAFALMIGVTAGAAWSHRAGRKAFWCAYPLMVTFVIVATANHFVDRRRPRRRVALARRSARAGCALARGRGLGLDRAGARPRRASRAARAAIAIELPDRAPPRARGEYQAQMRNRLIESRLTPNAISMTGLALCVVAAVLVWQEEFFLGGIAFIVGSVCDTLDGRYSRMSGKGTPFGAFLDSTLDRIEEGIVLAAVAAPLRRTTATTLAVAAVVIAVLASLMVSYTRARAEALGVECKVGIADRAVRVVILSAGLVFAAWSSWSRRCTCLRRSRRSPSSSASGTSARS